MGVNIIDIESKSLLGLAIDEVLHPFYVFQIASILLWSIDDYYYYAFAIALISVTSILSTLVETKRTIERMREMSRFHCDINVLVDGECEWIYPLELRISVSDQSRDCQGLQRYGSRRHLRRVRPESHRLSM
jgi:magnesium-transporting ATPase (P-type)